jgi:hypothetical protein
MRTTIFFIISILPESWFHRLYAFDYMAGCPLARAAFSIAGGNAAAILLASIPGERDSRCDPKFLVEKNRHNRCCPVFAGPVAGSFSEPKPFADTIAA